MCRQQRLLDVESVKEKTVKTPDELDELINLIDKCFVTGKDSFRFEYSCSRFD